MVQNKTDKTLKTYSLIKVIKENQVQQDVDL